VFFCVLSSRGYSRGYRGIIMRRTVLQLLQCVAVCCTLCCTVCCSVLSSRGHCGGGGWNHDASQYVAGVAECCCVLLCVALLHSVLQSIEFARASWGGGLTQTHRHRHTDTQTHTYRVTAALLLLPQWQLPLKARRRGKGGG